MLGNLPPHNENITLSVHYSQHRNPKNGSGTNEASYECSNTIFGGCMNFNMLYSQAETTPRCHHAMSKQVSVKIRGYDRMICGNI